ncbi:MAG: hypothetical protein ACREO3_04155 [Arenimonas sp.]
MQKQTALSLAILLPLAIAGCDARLPQASGATDAQLAQQEYDRQIAKSAEQQEQTERQLAKFDEQQALAEQQSKRMEVLLARWEAQADRYDAVLARWEKQPGSGGAR